MCYREMEFKSVSFIERETVNIPVPGHGDKRSLRVFSAVTQTNSVTLNRARARVLFSS
uniref:Uncharacterized protein n=1 Tax=Parascaris univalens TaxID=6257 RepID=A0A915BLI4_PARUN